MIYPTGTELGVLVMVMLQLLLGGFLVKAVLIEKHRFVSFNWAALMLFVAVSVIVAQTAIMKQNADPARTLPVLFWCFAFALIPMAYFIKTIVDALSEQTNQRISPIGTHIEDAGEFNAARKLAQKGDIEGAIALYRGYRDNRSGALLEAARLLRTEERFPDAVAMFQEISERYGDNKVVWAEATYSLAKIMETNLGQPIGAMQYLQQIRKRTPESKYSQMANSDLMRLQVMTGTKLEESENTPLGANTVGDAYSKSQAPLAFRYDREHAAQDLLDAPIPERDPFLTRDIYTQRGTRFERKEEPIHRAVVKKSVAKKKSTSKKISTDHKKPAPVKSAAKAVAKTKSSAPAKKKASVSQGKKVATPKAKAKISSISSAAKKTPSPKKTVARSKAKS